jgi:hypothetical protein
VLNIAYVALVVEVILLIFLFKTYMYQLGLAPTLSTTLPSVMISVSAQIFTKIYTIIIKHITIF